MLLSPLSWALLLRSLVWALGPLWAQFIWILIRNWLCSSCIWLSWFSKWETSSMSWHAGGLKVQASWGILLGWSSSRYTQWVSPYQYQFGSSSVHSLRAKSNRWGLWSCCLAGWGCSTGMGLSAWCRLFIWFFLNVSSGFWGLVSFLSQMKGATRLTHYRWKAQCTFAF